MQTGINEEYLLEQIAQMDQIILKAMGAKEIMTAQLQYLQGASPMATPSQGSSENGDKPKQEEKKTGPQPAGRSEDEYTNGNGCRTGDCG